MLLFTGCSLDGEQRAGGGWIEQSSGASALGLSVEVTLGVGQHGVTVRSEVGTIVEVVAPAGAGVDGDPVSSFHLPPYYRWRVDGVECRFAAEWRDGAPSVTTSLRHMASLRSHPRALVVDDPQRQDDLDGAPASTIVVSAPRAADHPQSGASSAYVDWRGWHVVEAADPFDGPRRRVLATHTQLFGPLTSS